MTSSRVPAAMRVASARETSAEIIAAPLAGLRHRDATGTVLASFERSAYLDLGGRILALVSSELDPGPFTISVDRFCSLGPIAPAEPVSLQDGRLRIGQGTVDLRRARTWNPVLPPLYRQPGPGLMNKVRNAVLAEIRADASRSDPGTPDALWVDLSIGLDAIAAFLSGGSWAATARVVASRIAGRGPGLTPAGDDLVIGIVHALTLWPSLARAAGGLMSVRDKLIDATVSHTTRISAAYLEAARKGWGSAPWHALARGIGEGPDAARAAAQRILSIGETSGADALVGFCWAWRRIEA